MKHRRVISISSRTAPPRDVCIVPCKMAHKSSACVSSSWCLNQRLRLFPKRHVRKTLASILSKKATMVIKEEREICPDFVALNRLSSSRRLVTQTKLD